MVCRKQFWTLNELANKMKRKLVTKLSGSGDLRIGGVFGTTKKKIYLVLTRTIIQCKPNHPTSKTLHKTWITWGHKIMSTQGKMNKTSWIFLNSHSFNIHPMWNIYPRKRCSWLYSCVNFYVQSMIFAIWLHCPFKKIPLATVRFCLSQVGLAVGDIESVQKHAFLRNKRRFIDFVFGVERNFPKFITRRFHRPQLVITGRYVEKKILSQWVSVWDCRKHYFCFVVICLWPSIRDNDRLVCLQLNAWRHIAILLHDLTPGYRCNNLTCSSICSTPDKHMKFVF